jgi:hypothetical protein
MKINTFLWSWDAFFITVIMDSVRRPSLLKPLCLTVWFNFLLQMNRIRNKAYSVMPLDTATLEPFTSTLCKGHVHKNIDTFININLGIALYTFLAVTTRDIAWAFCSLSLFGRVRRISTLTLLFLYHAKWDLENKFSRITWYGILSFIDIRSSCLQKSIVIASNS